MNTLDFVSLAVSTDQTRHNLTGVYRDTNKLVATDGHRMHWVNSLPDATPSYLDGRKDSQFPDISQVMPKGDPCYAFTFKIDKGDEKRLKGLLSLAKACDPKTPCVSVYVRDSRIVFHLVSKEHQTTATIEILGKVRGNTSDIIGLNLNYLLDAMAPALKGLGDVTIEPYGKMGPAVISCELPGQSYRAIVMPTRL